jgi:putative SOS response-associated peptidase YedK
MCGRFAITRPPEDLRKIFDYVEQPNFPPRYNIAPTQPVPILRAAHRDDGRRERRFSLMRWGFLPGFVKDPKDYPLVINARSETLLEKPSFCNALKRRRCLFMADVFYEWRRTSKGAAAQPFAIRRRDGAPMAFAGLWESWSGPNGEEVDTACIITTAANGAVAGIHARLPAVLEREAVDPWLDLDTRAPLGLVRPAGEALEFYAIGDAVNKVANDSPEVQVPLADQSVAEMVSRKAPSVETAPVQGSLF